MDLGKKSEPRTVAHTIKNIFWSSGGSLFYQAIRVLFQIILARFILPDDFGVFAIIIVLINVAIYFIENSFSLYYIRKIEISEIDKSTLWYINVIFSLVLILIIMMTAFFVNPIFINLEIYIALVISLIAILFNGLGSLGRAQFTREIRFKELVTYSLISTTVAGVFAVLSAYFKLDLWALVIYFNMYHFILNLILFMKVPVKLNRSSFDFNFLKESFVFSWKLVASGLIHSVYESVFSLFTAGNYSVSTLGLYNGALRIRDGLAQTSSDALQKVTYPYLALQRDDVESFLRSNKVILKYSMMILFPTLLGLVSISDELIKILFNENWYDMIPILKLLLIGGLFIPLQKINLNILVAMGRSDQYLILEVYKKLFVAIILVFVFVSKLNFIALLALLIFNGFFGYVINTFYTSKLINFGFWTQLREIYPVMVTSIIMYAGLMIVNQFVSNSNFLSILLKVAVGITIYFLVGIIFMKKDFINLYNFINLKLINK
jgi:O-antigen/teichoic acid export membrane protein